MGGCCSSPDTGNLDQDRNDAQNKPSSQKNISAMKTTTKPSGSVPKAPPPRRSLRVPPELAVKQAAALQQVQETAVQPAAEPEKKSEYEPMQINYNPVTAQDEPDSRIKLGYWKIRGVAQQIRYLLEYIGIEYKEDFYEQGDASTNYSVEEWTSVKDTLGLSFPQLPYLIDGDVKLTDPQAIMFYLSMKFEPELIGKTNEDKAKVDVLANVIKEVKKVVTTGCYDKNANRDALKVICLKRMKPLIEQLGDNEYIIGDYMTYLDFVFLELCLLVNFITEGEFKYHNEPIANYMMRMREMPPVKEYIQSDHYMSKPFHNKIATINNP